MGMEMSIQHITDVSEYHNVIGKSTCVVKFTAKWCGPCRTIAPKFLELAQENESIVKFLEIDIDLAARIADFERVQAIPLFLFFHEGKKNTNLSLSGSNAYALKRNVEELVELANISKISSRDDVTLESVVEESETSQPKETVSESSDENNDYGQDCDEPIPDELNKAQQESQK